MLVLALMTVDFFIARNLSIIKVYQLHTFNLQPKFIDDRLL